MKVIMQGWGLTAGFKNSEFRKVALNHLDYILEDHISELEGMAKGAKAGSGNLITFNDILVEVKEVADYMIPLSSLTKLALEETHDVENAYNIINASAKNPYAFSMIVGNETTLIATMNRPEYEYENKSDQIVYTNNFTMTEWQSALSDPTYSVERQNHAEGLVSIVSGDGIISNEEILTILKDESTIALGQNEVFGVATCAYFIQNNFGLGIAGNLVVVIPI